MRKVKIGLWLLAAVVVTVGVALQLLAMQDFIPDGPRVAVLAESFATTAAILGAIAAIALVFKAHRNLLSYLKVFVTMGLLMSVGSCSSWMERFHGPEKQIASADGRLVATVPSDWALAPAPPGQWQLVAADWAGTSGFSVSDGDIDDADPANLDAALVAMRGDVEPTHGKPVATVECGTSCKLDRYAVESRGKQMDLFTGLKIEKNRMFIIMVMNMAGREKDHPELLRIADSVHMAPRVP